MFRLRRPSPALVVACLALFISLGGASYAVVRVGSGQIRDNSVRSADLRNNDVRSKDLKDKGVAARDLAPHTVGDGAIADGAVDGRGIQDRSVDSADLGTDSVGSRELDEGALGTVPDAARLSGLGPDSFMASQVRVVTQDSPLVTAGVVSNTNDPVQYVTATCPSGERAIAGGGSWIIPAAGSTPESIEVSGELRASLPVPGTGGTSARAGWFVAGRNIATSGDRQRKLRAFAMCVPETP